MLCTYTSAYARTHARTHENYVAFILHDGSNEIRHAEEDVPNEWIRVGDLRLLSEQAR
jgi:hypothetical protein